MNVSESIRAMAERIMPICAASIHLNRQCSTRFIPLQYVEGMSIADLLESIMDGLNIPRRTPSSLDKQLDLEIGSTHKNRMCVLLLP